MCVHVRTEISLLHESLHAVWMCVRASGGRGGGVRGLQNQPALDETVTVSNRPSVTALDETVTVSNRRERVRVRLSVLEYE